MKIKEENEYIKMPRVLTAENGAKSLLMGEFYVESDDIFCEECDGTGKDELDVCYNCKGNGYYTLKTLVDWTTIKEIYAKAVEGLGEEIE